MSERTDQEQGTEPESVEEWKNDLEGEADTDPTLRPPTTSEAGQGSHSPDIERSAPTHPTAPPPTSEAGSEGEVG